MRLLTIAGALRLSMQGEDPGELRSPALEFKSPLVQLQSASNLLRTSLVYLRFAWLPRLNPITPLAVLSCACVIDNVDCWAHGAQTDVASLLLAVLVLAAAAVECHLAKRWVCRCLSALLASMLGSHYVFPILAFFDPTFGRKASQRRVPAASASRAPKPARRSEAGCSLDPIEADAILGRLVPVLQRHVHTITVRIGSC